MTNDPLTAKAEKMIFHASVSGARSSSLRDGARFMPTFSTPEKPQKGVGVPGRLVMPQGQCNQLASLAPSGRRSGVARRRPRALEHARQILGPAPALGGRPERARGGTPLRLGRDQRAVGVTAAGGHS
jgi:hypothetical protein